MNTIRIQDGIAVEIFTNESKVDLAEKFHPSILAMCVETEDDVEQGWLWDGEDGFSAPIPDPVDIEALKERKILQAFQIMSQKLEEAKVYVDISAGEAIAFACDTHSRENIIGVNAAITAGIPIDNPRYWTPSGNLMPILVSHADFALIGKAILDKKDALYTIYAGHKYYISTLEDAEDIAAYDASTGY